MLTPQQLNEITKAQIAKQNKFRSVSENGQYIDYLGKKFLVYRDVFWPYDDSAALVQNFTVEPGELVLDIGTGCGVIAIFAAEKGAKKVVALDINPAAVKAAEHNAKAYSYEDIIEVRCSDLFQKIAATEKFDVIIVNLPFRNKEAKDFVEASFWDSAFNSNLRFFQEVDKYLKPDGRIYISQANYGNVEEMKKIAKKAGFISKLIGKKTMGANDVREFYAFELRRSK